MRRVRQNRGSIIVIVMVTIIFTAAALVAFLDKASNELLVASHVKTANRMREDAYSALNVVLGTIQDFINADGKTLHSPTEGWGQIFSKPLPWVVWSPAMSNHTVDVSFTDESGKVPIMKATPTMLLDMFETWGLSQDDAQKMVDNLLTWTHTVPNYVPAMATLPDYETDNNPYDPPLRSIRSYQELASIDFVRDTLFDANGLPNELFWRFYTDFSLFNYTAPNINSAPPDVLVGVGQFTDAQQQNIAAYLAGTGDFVDPGRVQALGGQWFGSTTTLKNVAGGQGNASLFGTTISALRILITVHEGLSQYRLSVVVAPVTSAGGARTVQTTATDAQQSASNATSGEASAAPTLASTAPGPKATPTTAQTSAAKLGNANLQFPFTILEIAENDQILTPPDTPFPPPVMPNSSGPAPSAASSSATAPTSSAVRSPSAATSTPAR